jgi:phosphoglucomutase
MVAYERDKGRSLHRKLQELYLAHGLFREHLVSITRKGMDGQQQIAAMMERFRNDPPRTLNGVPVVRLLDYEKRESRDLLTGTVEPITLPRSNVLQFVLADGGKVSARPSGTEPKIKFYFSVRSAVGAIEDIPAAEAALDASIRAMTADLGV